MTSVKALAIIALLVGGTSLAPAQNGPATGNEPPVAGGAAGNPAVLAPGGPPGPGVIPGAPAQSSATQPSRTRIVHHTTRHPKKMYMMRQ
jgi:hypothetical protein